MSKSIKKKEENKTTKIFPVVGIGASAGGLDAIKVFFSALPADPGMAFIVIQHLHADYESALPEILKRETKLPIKNFDDKVIAPNHVYVIPPNKILKLVNGIPELKPRPDNKESIHPIDIAFSAIAEAYQSYALGIVLSGTGTDGTLGLKKVKDFGGITLAQSPDSASHDGMPSSAINSDVVDFILAPGKMPEQLGRLYETIKLIPDDEKISAELLNEEDNFKQIISMLRIRRGVDFTYYKQTTIRRRILRRMLISKIKKLADYLQFLRNNKPELDILYQDMLIPVTGFFRDSDTFERLCEHVFPHILKNKSVNNPLRVWIAGCSTGEEAYSVGICLHEYLGEHVSTIKVQIFATDISERSIEKARSGIYNKREIEGISETRIKHYFTKIDGHYQVKKSIRDLCVFASHNFLKDPPFARIDLISCRNVLIYMEGYLQRKALSTFHYALNDKGYLLLGKSESVSNATELFVSASKTDKMYTRKSVSGRFMNLQGERNDRSKQDFDTMPHVEKKRNDYQKNADDILLSRFTPAGVIVNEQFDIVQFRGSTGLFLEAAPGKASLNILKMAREGLSFEIRNALHKAKTSSEPVRKEDIPLSTGLTVSIEVIPLLNTIEIHYLILFEESSPENASEDEANQSFTENPAENVRIQQLEKTLTQLREDMRTITEEQEAANEELQSANEELLSGSEELQSLNEELETSKEELQSSNEELMTVNQELYDRNEQFNQARLYAETIVSTIHEPFIVLNRDLRIKTANQSFYEKFSLSEEDTNGRILYELQDKNWDLPSLRTELLKIQTGKLTQSEWDLPMEIPGAGTRMICIHAQQITPDNREQLILLAFDDITLRKIAEEKLEETTELIRKERKVLHDFVRQNPAMLFVLKGPDHKLELANKNFQKFINIDELDGQKIIDRFNNVIPGSMQEALDKVYSTGKGYEAIELPIRFENHHGSENMIRYIDLSIQPLTNDKDEVEGLLVYTYDVSQKVEARKKVEENAATLELILEALPQVAWTAGPEGNIRFFNRNWYEYVGNEKDENLSSCWKKIVHPAMIDERIKKWQYALQTGTAYSDEFLAKKAADSSYRWHMIETSTVKDEDGHISLWVGTLIDIHDQRLFSEELEKKVLERTESLKNTNLELLHSNKSLEQFAYIASHDLQEPLRKVKTFTTIFEQNYLNAIPEEGRQYIHKIHLASERMSALIKDVLNYSRITQDQSGMVKTDLNGILNNVLHDFELLGSELKAEFKIDKLPFIQALPLQMNQLFYNLVGNSLKFSDKKRNPVIEITAEVLSEGEKANYLSLDPDKEYTKIIFKDNGIGFEQDFAEQIFMIFQRLHSKSDFEGTGIGLALCQKIVFAHHGLIWAEGNPGVGASFNIVLPFEQ